MKQVLLFLLVFSLLSSCIPLRVAPNIKEDKIKIAKRFKRHLPKQYSFIFKDHKDADEFYHFINTKYDLNNESVDDNVPFKVDEKEFSFSFYEVEKVTKTLNLLPIVADAALDNNDVDPVFEETYTSRKGHWYIVIIANDSENKDCLNENHPERDKVINYLRALRKEYLNTNNYLEAQLKEKSKKDKISID